MTHIKLAEGDVSSPDQLVNITKKPRDVSFVRRNAASGQRDAVQALQSFYRRLIQETGRIDG